MAFYTALRYDIDIECCAPLRTGGASGNNEAVLRRADGRAIVQASSLAGALRQWATNHLGEDVTNSLFGSHLGEGSLIFADIVFDPASEELNRPRVSLAGASGTQKNLFELSALKKGSHGRTTLLWTGQNDDQMATCATWIEAMLSAVQGGFITLGAQKTNGYGVLTVTKARKRTYRLTDAEDRIAWLEQREATEPCELQSDGDIQYVTFLLKGHTSSFLTKGGKDASNLSEGADKVLSGASVKGVIRSRFRMMAGLKVTAVTGEHVEQWFGRATRNIEENIAGSIRFFDTYFSSVKEKNTTRVRIDRFTGGIMNKATVRETPLAAEATIRISVPADQKAACGMMLFALRDLGLGLYSLGGGHAIGRGYFEVESVEASGGSIAEPVKMIFENGATLVSGEATAAEWMTALGGDNHDR